MQAKNVTDEGFKHLLYALLNDLVWDYANAYVKLQAETDDAKRLRSEQTVKEIESYVSKQMFDDIVNVLELMVDGPKLLNMIRNDPNGVIGRMMADPRNVRVRKNKPKQAEQQ